MVLKAEKIYSSVLLMMPSYCKQHGMGAMGSSCFCLQSMINASACKPDGLHGALEGVSLLCLEGTTGLT